MRLSASKAASRNSGGTCSHCAGSLTAENGHLCTACSQACWVQMANSTPSGTAQWHPKKSTTSAVITNGLTFSFRFFFAMAFSPWLEQEIIYFPFLKSLKKLLLLSENQVIFCIQLMI
jgi:hypothetical protein